LQWECDLMAALLDSWRLDEVGASDEFDSVGCQKPREGKER